ncbi:MAG: formate dehydrogenase accessory protein FdhE, partial [Bilophila sp.]
MHDATLRLLAALRSSHPEHEAVIEAFTPLTLTRLALLERFALKHKAKGNATFPLLTVAELPVCAEKSGIMAQEVLKAMQEGFPAVRTQLDALAALTPAAVRTLCKARLSGNSGGDDAEDADSGEATLAAYAAKHALAAELLEMLIAQVCCILVARSAQALPEAASIHPTETERQCPYCGSEPELSVVHSTEGKRDLLCATCGRHWRYQRTACAFCGTDEPGN